jgi:hypothetical protein
LLWLQHAPPVGVNKGGQIGRAGTDTAGGGRAPGGNVNGGCMGGISVRGGGGGGSGGGRHAPELRCSREQQIVPAAQAPDAGIGKHRVAPANCSQHVPPNA